MKLSQSETRLKNKVLKYIKHNYHAFVYKPNDRFTSGIPDIIMCVDSKFVAIELKVGNNQPTALQEYMLRKIRLAGGYTSVCRSVDDVKIFLEKGVMTNEHN